MFAGLIESSSDFISIADANGTPTYLNPAGRRMVGLPPDYAVEETHVTDYYTPGLRSFASDVIGGVHWSSTVRGRGRPSFDTGRPGTRSRCPTSTS